jgi:uncharacterized membrane protein YccC
MKELLNNSMAQGILVTLACAFVFWIVAQIRFRIDERKIVVFLEKSKDETDYAFRSEPAISSEANLSEDRINKVCSKSIKITRNKQGKKSWCLAN